MNQDLFSQLRKMINEEENNPSYTQTPNFSPSPLKSRLSRLSRRSKGDATPETKLRETMSKSRLDTEMKLLEDKILEKSQITVSRETEKLKTEVSEFMLEIVKEFKKFK